MKHLALFAVALMLLSVSYSQSKKPVPVKSPLFTIIQDPFQVHYETDSDTLTIYSHDIHYIKIDDHIFEIQRSVQLWEVKKPILNELQGSIQWSRPSMLIDHYTPYTAPATIAAIDTTVIFPTH